MIGIIGGSGLYSGLKDLKGERKNFETPYGKVEIIEGEKFVFVSRHGEPPLPPHMVNYHANMFVFKMRKVKEVIAISSVGSLHRNIEPGTLLLPDDLLDFTPRIWTYHNTEPFHANLYEPFCRELRDKIARIENLKIGGTYATMKGPQFETKGEKKMLQILGADVVGMTVAPEAKLARELNLCYQPICLVVNYVDEKTTHENTVNMVKKMESRVIEMIHSLLRS